MYQYSYRQLQIALYEANDTFDTIKLDQALNNGAVIKNNGKKHTLNYAIRKLSRRPKINKFDLVFITKLIDNGALICNYEYDNTLSIIIKNYIQNMSKNYQNAKQNNNNCLRFCEEEQENIIKLIQLLISYGAKPSNSSSEYNTLNLAIKTNNLKIVNIACELGAIPNNFYGPNNTLALALISGDPEIVEKVIIMGAVLNFIPCQRNCICYEHDFLPKFCKKYLCYESKFKFNECTLNRIINLLLCVEKIVPGYMEAVMTPYKFTRPFQYEKMMDYDKLCRKIRTKDTKITENNDSDTIECERIKKLAQNLKGTIDNLIEKSYNKKYRLVEIDTTIKLMPLCCINIIYEYQCTEPLIKQINWTVNI